MRSDKQISLLPFIREDIYGASYETNQVHGWEIKKFDIKNQWKLSMGEDVIVAVIDTGCDLDHLDIKNNIIKGFNFVDPSKDPYDDNGHGTHVAGTIAAENNEFGMVGISPKTKIMPVKALDGNGNGNINNIAKAIAWSADNNADFIGMSLGSPSGSKILENAINYAAAKGSVIFCAAGNSGEDTDIMYPAKYNNTIAIGAIDKNLNRTNFTCSGDTLDFLSPGQEILSCVPGGGYAIMSGTSMSTPFAIGCASLLLSYRRSMSRHIPSSCEEYIDIFKTKAKDLNDPRYSGIKKYQGYGILYPVL